MSSYVKSVLLPHEKVVYGTTLHWIIYLQGLLITVFGGVLGYYIPTILTFLFGSAVAHQYTRPLVIFDFVIILAGAILLFGAYIRQSSTELVVTNCRIIAKYGFVSRATFEIMLSRVTGANFDQTVWGRILGYGTIIVHGAGGDISPFDNVANPQAFHTYLIGVLEPGNRGQGARDQV